MKTRATKRLNKRQRAKVVQWLGDAYNMGFSGLRGFKLTPDQHEARMTVIEDATIAAVLDYDSSKGASFSTYLFRRIRWAILTAGRPPKNKVSRAVTFTDLMAEDA